MHNGILSPKSCLTQQETLYRAHTPSKREQNVSTLCATQEKTERATRDPRKNKSTLRAYPIIYISKFLSPPYVPPNIYIIHKYAYEVLRVCIKSLYRNEVQTYSQDFERVWIF